MEVWLMQGQSICIVALMLLGILKRRDRRLHVRLMYSAIIWDIILILQIELSRSAILKASAAMKNPMILNVHVLLAVSAVVLYGFMIYSGRQMLRAVPGVRARHRVLGYTTFLVRILVLITSYWAVVPKE